MSTKKLAVQGAHIVCAVACFVALQLPTLAAEGSQCAPRVIAQNIKDAVLALKATQYCVGEQLPYGPDEAYARIESLRCGMQSSALLDELMNDFEQEYKGILTRDTRHVVCMKAASLSLK